MGRQAGIPKKSSQTEKKLYFSKLEINGESFRSLQILKRLYLNTITVFCYLGSGATPLWMLANFPSTFPPHQPSMWGW